MNQELIVRLHMTVKAVRLIAEGIAWGALAALAIMCLILVSTALGQAHAAQPPAPGMLCTYTKQVDPGRDTPRTYTVEVVAHFERAEDANGQPWLWVKRPGQARYLSVLATAADLSECQR